mgnify:FL=1
MDRKELEQFIIDNYNCNTDYPWIKYPSFEVFRHTNNKKWFALIMDISKDKLGLESNEIISVVNFKCDPILIGSLLREKGFFPAYHMSKNSWITVALNNSVDNDKIKMLLDLSYQLTADKIKKKS